MPGMKTFSKTLAAALCAVGCAVGESFAAGNALEGSEWISVPGAAVAGWNGSTHDGGLRAAPGVSWFVRELANDGEVVRAVWTTAGLGVYEVYVNGVRIGDEFLKPGFTHNAKTKYSFAYDVTDAMRRAKGASNVFAAEVSAGWWRDKIVNFAGKKSAFRGVLELTFADGSTRRYGTNVADWKAGVAGPVREASIFDGEVYDARVPSGCDRAVWTAFGAPEVNAEFKGEILPTGGAEVYLREDIALRPVKAYTWKGVDGASDKAFGKVKVVSEFANEGPFVVGAGETLVVDFGQNCAAVPRFRFSAPAGTTLTAKPAEMLNDDDGLKSRGNDGPEGSVYRVNLRSGHENGRLVRYTFAGRAFEDYMPRFTFFGYRYVSVTATAPVVIERFESVPVTSIRREMERGTVFTGDRDVNRLVANVWWGQLSNYLSVPTDCPQRDERLGWAADTQVFCEAATFNANVYDFLRKWMRDERDSQHEKGGFPGVAPRAQYGNEPMRLGWADAGVIVPYQMFKQYGDRRIVDENWAAMEKFVGHVAETRYATANIKDECCNYQWNDWLSLTRLESAPYKPEYSAFGWDKDRGRFPKPEAVRYWDYLGGCFWATDAQMMSEMAALTGRAADAAKYRAMAADAKAYLKKTFFAADGALEATFDGMQTPMFFALRLGLVEGAAKAKTIANLKASIAANGGTLHSGFLGTSIAMDVLTENGMADVAYDLLFNHRFPGWLYSVDQGATTIWERWNSYTKDAGFGPVGMNSFNHYAYGAVLAWIYKTAAGIAADPAAPGFERIVMKPVPDRRLGFIDAEFVSPKGLVKSAWRFEGKKWIWDFAVPEGSTALVTLPGETAAKDYPAGSHSVVLENL